MKYPQFETIKKISASIIEDCKIDETKMFQISGQGYLGTLKQRMDYEDSDS